QAVDGIRDFHVTGVQTCALPISEDPGAFAMSATEEWIAQTIAIPPYVAPQEVSGTGSFGVELDVASEGTGTAESAQQEASGTGGFEVSMSVAFAADEALVANRRLVLTVAEELEFRDES